MKRNDEVRVTRCLYPNGEEWYRVSIRGVNHGGFAERTGGFVVDGCRKPLRTRLEAAREVLRRACRSHMRQAANLSLQVDWPVVFDDTIKKSEFR